MRIAIVGTGIAGNGAAWALSHNKNIDLTIFEQEGRLGGHSATVEVANAKTSVAVDTGFIVYNELNYPHFTNLMSHLGVRTQDSDMSFSLSDEASGQEWCGRSQNVLSGLFARKQNLFSPSFMNMLLEVRKFGKTAIKDLEEGRLTGLSLGEYLDESHFSKELQDYYLIPMGAAIWSMPITRIPDFPAESYVAFFRNHHLLQWDRPVWRTVSGGSREYVKVLTQPFADRIRKNTKVISIRRDTDGVILKTEDGKTEKFDKAIIATHSDQALIMLEDSSEAEQLILGSIKYRSNDVILHKDQRLMPRRRAAWASWNVHQSLQRQEDLCVTYWMNILQDIDKTFPLFVTLNPDRDIPEEHVFGRFSYAHPQFDAAAMTAQTRLNDIQGKRHIWFCGAWTGYGFHEDGLKSGFDVARALGGIIPWEQSPMLEAAE
ncbi:FAD-dependent oxidoreductase [Microvirga sp. W0021]|uniref:FAD-dependent oxidoreductase n=1 Tax=Hohaiivirga grylli TaxID=3133970 RepID=A0ABV0BIM3_9HYPH